MSSKYVDYIKARKKIAPYTLRLIARMAVESDRRLQHHRRFIKRMKDAEASCIQKFDDLPRNATIRKEYVRCGKNSCEMRHGPYYYAYWKEKVPDKDTGVAVRKVKKRYIGSYLPAKEIPKPL